MVGPIASMDLQSRKSGCHHCAPAVLRAQDSQVHVAPLWRVRTCFGCGEEEVTCRGWNQKGKFSGTVTANYTVPMIATTAESMMKGARRSVRAATQAPNTMPMLANAFGGAVVLRAPLGRKVLRLRFTSYESQTNDDRRLNEVGFRMDR